MCALVASGRIFGTRCLFFAGLISERKPLEQQERALGVGQRAVTVQKVAHALAGQAEVTREPGLVAVVFAPGVEHADECVPQRRAGSGAKCLSAPRAFCARVFF